MTFKFTDTYILGPSLLPLVYRICIGCVSQGGGMVCAAVWTRVLWCVVCECAWMPLVPFPRWSCVPSALCSMVSPENFEERDGVWEGEYGCGLHSCHPPTALCYFTRSFSTRFSSFFSSLHPQLPITIPTLHLTSHPHTFLSLFFLSIHIFSKWPRSIP
jgi:hypothetical protein